MNPQDVYSALQQQGGVARLQKQYGGTTTIDPDGSARAHITPQNRPIPPPSAMRKMHADRQERLGGLHSPSMMLWF
eukprot:2256911-Amphidinium_carterae.1